MLPGSGTLVVTRLVAHPRAGQQVAQRCGVGRRDYVGFGAPHLAEGACHPGLGGMAGVDDGNALLSPLESDEREEVRGAKPLG